MRDFFTALQYMMVEMQMVTRMSVNTMLTHIPNTVSGRLLSPMK